MVPIAYNVRNLAVRKATTAATLAGLGLVVFVFATALMFSAGMRQSLDRTADPTSVIVLRQGAATELNSGIEDSKVALVLARPEVAHNDHGNPDGAAEIVSTLRLPKIGTDGLANVLIRGVPDDARAFHRRVKIVEGREPKPGTDEVMIGRGLLGRYKGLAVNQTLELPPNRVATIVGVFDAGGSSYESEIWGGTDTLRAAFSLQSIVSSIRVHLTSRDAFTAFRSALEVDKQLGLEAQNELAYYDGLSGGLNALIGAIAVIIALAFSICAMLGATITLRTSIANRQREIGTLRALGFSRGSILLSFLFESVFMSLLGGAIGAGASLAMSMVKLSVFNASGGSDMVFSFQPTPVTVVSALVLAVLMGAIGGFLPALRAARLNPVDAMRT